MSLKEKYKLEYSITLYKNAVERFSEAVNTPLGEKDSLVLDASIQRFEFCFEMSWKTLKRFLEYKGIPTKTPRDAFKQAFKLGWLTEGDSLWSQMIDDRNLTSHTYNREIAMKVYNNLAKYELAYQRLLTDLYRILSE